MKMAELRLENESLKQQVQLLSQQKAGETEAAVTQLKDKNRTLKKSVKELKAENAGLMGRIQALENEKASSGQEHQNLKSEMARVRQQLSELSSVHARETAEMESLYANQKALSEKAAQIPGMQVEIERLQQVESLYGEKAGQAAALQAELERSSQLLDEARATSSTKMAEWQGQYAQLAGELETHRQQSTSQVASLQAQNEGLSAKVTDLTGKLKLVATLLERQNNEKKKIASQYEASLKEYQAYKEKAEKQTNDMMGLLKKMAAELDASRHAHPTPETAAGAANPADPLGVLAADKRPQVRVEDLQERIAELDQINTSQARELMTMQTRMKRIDRAFSTPFGRVISQMLGLKGGAPARGKE